MKKEVIIAILIGLGLGLIVTYGVYRARRALVQGTPQVQNLSSPTPTSELTTTASDIIISSPVDQAVTDQTLITVAGTTNPNSFVVLVVNQTEYITTADESGNFSVEVELEENANFITVTSIDEDGNAAQIEITVVHTTETFGSNSPDTDQTTEETQDEE